MTTVPEVGLLLLLLYLLLPFLQVVLALEAGLLYSSIALPTDYDCWKESQVLHLFCSYSCPYSSSYSSSCSFFRWWTWLPC